MYIAGTYVLKDDLLLATPPPPPSEANSQPTNPLATTPQPARAGTKVSLLNLSSGSLAPLLYRPTTGNSNVGRALQRSIEEHPQESSQSSDAASGGSDTGDKSAPSSARESSAVPVFGEDNHLLSGSSRDAGKRRKSKTNMAKSNSSFVSRCMVNDTLSKKLSDRPDNGYFAFANVGRGFQWLDLSSEYQVSLSNPHTFHS